MSAPFDSGDSESVKVEVILTRAAWTAVGDLTATSDLSRTDVINRAVQFYCMVEMERRMAGNDVAMVKPDGNVSVLSFSDDPAEVRERFHRWSRRLVENSQPWWRQLWRSVSPWRSS